MAVEAMFFIALGLAAYAYVGYPLLVLALSRSWPRPVRAANITPRISLIIAAHNEQATIAQKIENCLELDYPPDNIQIIVASDCSDDATETIAARYASRGVLVHRSPDRLGKSVVQNCAVKAATGEILVFSDATTIYRRDALKEIVKPFADPEVGCVAGQLIYVRDEQTAAAVGCHSYWSYEKFLRNSESRLGSLIGVSGCLYAVRRSSYARIALDMSSDFVIASEMHRQGLRTVYQPSAIAVEKTNVRGHDEFRMRVRVIEQTMSAIHLYRDLLNPFTHGMFAVQLISHKILRYSIPALMIVILAATAALAASSPVFALLLALQVAFYLIALVGWFCERAGVRLGALGLPYYLVLGNAATLVAFVKFLRGEAHVVWEPVRDSATSEGI